MSWYFQNIDDLEKEGQSDKNLKKLAAKYGLDLVKQCGIEYVLCPTCKQGWKNVDKAKKCCNPAYSSKEDSD